MAGRSTQRPWVGVQAYVLRDRQLTAAMLERAREAGARAVVLTVDTPVVGQKHSTGPSVWETVPPEYLLANVDWHGLEETRLEKAADLTPATIDWLRDRTGRLWHVFEMLLVILECQAAAGA